MKDLDGSLGPHKLLNIKSFAKEIDEDQHWIV